MEVKDCCTSQSLSRVKLYVVIIINKCIWSLCFQWNSSLSLYSRRLGSAPVFVTAFTAEQSIAFLKAFQSEQLKSTVEECHNENGNRILALIWGKGLERTKQSGIYHYIKMQGVHAQSLALGPFEVNNML